MRRAIDTMADTDVHEDVMDADRAFHQSLLRASGSLALVFFADALSDVLAQDLLKRSGELTRHRLTTSVRKLLVDHHERIYRAILDGHEEQAMDAVDPHFDALNGAHTAKR
jgi:DNA-binding FadR family transcriptional regulator